MTGALILASIALLLGLAAVAQLLPGRGRSGQRGANTGPAPGVGSLAGRSGLAAADARLGLSGRIARAGLPTGSRLQRCSPPRRGSAMAGRALGLVLAPSAPSRLAWISPRRYRRRGSWVRTLGSSVAPAGDCAGCAPRLPDALDLLAVGTAAGRSPLAGLAELGTGEGPLARELAMLSAESSCGLAQSEALDSLRRRAPVREVAAMCGVIERSRRYGSPLADQLHEQATALRGVQRRRIEEQAARAAPKIQLAVALLLVPSVLLMIAAGLLANIDRFMAGF